MSKVVIIGGGIVGLSSAYYLQQSGHQVTLIDKTDISDNCSYGNAGWLTPLLCHATANAGSVFQSFGLVVRSRKPPLY